MSPQSWWYTQPTFESRSIIWDNNSANTSSQVTIPWISCNNISESSFEVSICIYRKNWGAIMWIFNKNEFSICSQYVWLLNWSTDFDFLCLLFRGFTFNENLWFLMRFKNGWGTILWPTFQPHGIRRSIQENLFFSFSTACKCPRVQLIPFIYAKWELQFSQ